MFSYKVVGVCVRERDRELQTERERGLTSFQVNV